MGNPYNGVMEQSWLPKAGVRVLSGCYFGASLPPWVLSPCILGGCYFAIYLHPSSPCWLSSEVCSEFAPRHRLHFCVLKTQGKMAGGEAEAGLQDEDGQSFNTSRHEELGMVEQYRKRLFPG